MVNRSDPVEYLASLNNEPDGSLLNMVDEYIEQVNGALQCCEIGNGQRISLGEVKTQLEGVKDDIEQSKVNSWIEAQKVKCQAAIDEVM